MHKRKGHQWHRVPYLLELLFRDGNLFLKLAASACQHRCALLGKARQSNRIWSRFLSAL